MQNEAAGILFENFLKHTQEDPALITLGASYICSDIIGLMAAMPNARIENITAEGFFALITGLTQKTLSSRGAKDALTQVLNTGGDLAQVMQQYLQTTDPEEMVRVVDQTIASEEKAVVDYRGGKTAILQYLVGKAMKASNGSGNPETLRKLFIEKLG
jgi:aspartyl-tRNA(Asn)/glutamyl-tRNA(Gln) amidotransferase subunit B